MNEIININNIDPNTFEFQDYSVNDTSLITSIETESTFDPSTDIIEYFVYDLNNNILFQNTSGWPLYRLVDNKVYINPTQDLNSVGFNEGQYNTLYNFVSPILASNSSQNYFIAEISTDRTELRLNTTQIASTSVISSTQDLINTIENSTESYYDFYVNFGNNQLIIANNVLLDDTDPTAPTVLIKLYEPLPPQFTLNRACWVVRQIANSIAYNVNILRTFDIEDENIKLRGPNVNINVKDQINNATDFKSFQSLNQTTSSLNANSLQYQLNSILNQAGVEINVDYTDYSDFIHFSSALTRLENFYYKLSLIETYQQNANLSNTTPINFYVSSSNVVWQNKIDEIITDFDDYEYFLYFESSSAAWPKTNQTPPYVNAATTSSVALNWLNSQSTIAEDYDTNNNNALVNTIPSYLREDPNNAQYELFVEMIGQYFDTVFLYIKDITNKYNRDNRVNVGVSKELVADILRDLGIKIYQNNFSSNDLYSSLLGITPSGSLFNLPFTTTNFPVTGGFEYIQTYVTASATGSLIPSKDINYETYKRIYANLPYLLKKKGTVEGLRSLITLYGIPDTILRINEYGGKDKDKNTWDYWQNEYNYTFSTAGNGFVNVPWDGDNEFVSTWRTSNTSVSSSAADQIELPLVSTGTYSMTVDWGDGTSDTITTWNQPERRHTYSTPGDYTVTIRGTCRGWRFFVSSANLQDHLKILNVSRWKALDISTNQAFQGCSNLNATATDFPKISTTNLSSCFSGCASFNGAVGNWRVRNVTTMSGMFFGCTIFNQPLSNWKVQNVTNMNIMFGNASAFNQNIGAWNVSKVTTMGSMFRDATSFNQNIGSWNTAKVTDMSFMFFIADAFNQNIGSWNTSNVTSMRGMFSNATSFNQPLGDWDVSKVTRMDFMFSNTSFNQNIDNWNVGNVTNFESLFSSTPFNQNIGAWNVNKVTNFNNMFNNASSFNNGGSADINNWTINTTQNVNMTQMFINATAFNQNIGSWNTGNVTNMTGMFAGASAFNQNIGSWNTGNVTNMSSIFSSASAFNNGGSGDINNWVTTNVTNMNSMFRNATAFNQPIGSWNTSNVTVMGSQFNGMFRNAVAFNQDISGWNVGNVTNMNGMFLGATSFNQNIGAWNVNKVTIFGIGSESIFFGATAFNNGGSADINNWTINTTQNVNMGGMFRDATAFNQNIGSWNTGMVTNMVGMFQNATAFNQNIGSWNTGNVTNMTGMFAGASAFNQNIGSWNTGNVTTMSGLFSGTSAFNQDISGWDVSKVTTFGIGQFQGMFYNATAFNQNLSAWQLRTAGTQMIAIFRNSGMSCANYTDTLVGWANYVFNNSNTPLSVDMTLQTGRVFATARSGGANFADADAARTYLTTASPTGADWSITGDTLQTNC